MKKFTLGTVILTAILVFCLQFNGVAQTPYVMSNGDYTEAFTNIANTTNWPNGFNGTDCQEWASVLVNATGTIGDGVKTTVSTATFSTGSSGGVQRGSANIYMLSTGTTNACAIDLLLDFTGRNAGTISFNLATVFNSTGDRDSKLKLFYSTNGTTFTEITGTNLPYTARNNVAGSATISNINLPSALNGVSTARLRFYEYSTATGTTPTGSQPKISIDNISITSTSSSSAPTVSTEAATDLGTTSATGNGTISADGGAAISTHGFCWDLAANADPTISLTTKTTDNSAITTGSFTGLITGLTPNTSYKVRAYATNIAGTGYGSAVTFTTSESLIPTVSVSPTTLSGFTYLVGSGPSAEQTFAVSGVNLTAPIDLASSTNYEISLTTGTGYTTSISLSPSSGTVLSTTIFVRLKAGLSAGSYNSENITATSTTSSQSVSCSGSVTVPPPVITVTGTISSFGTTVINTYSTEKTYSVSAVNLTSDLVITPPAGFQISTTSGSGFVGSTGNITLTPSSGSVASTLIYVRFAPLSVQNYSGNILNASTGATTQNVAVAGSGICESAAFPFVEDFNYTPALLSNYCWTVHSTGTNPITVASNPISYTGYASSGIGNAVTLANTGEDINRTFTAQTSGTIYAAFMVNVTSATTTGDYFFHLAPNIISTTFRGRVFAKKDASNNLLFGVSQNGTAVYSTVPYALNTTYLVVLKYIINSGASNDVAELYINPLLHRSEPSTGWLVNTDTPNDPTDIGSVALRQGNSSNAPAVVMDGIRISNNWADIVGTIIPENSTFNGTGNWSSVANWSNGLPGSITNVIVDGNLTVNDYVDCNDFTIAPTGTVTVSSSQGLIVNGNLLVQSSASGTGSFIADATDYTITGTSTFERFLTKYDAIGDDMFHFLSSPVAAQAIQPGFVSLPNSTDDFYSWDETSNQWINSVDNGGSFASGFESNFTVGKGYLVAYPADVTKTFTGALNTGNVATALTYTPAQGNGWNLLGNPYPSAIDWDNVSGTNLDDAVYVYDNASATYKSYVDGVGTLTDGIIPSTQGFFVHANGASPSLTLENQDRVHAGTAFYKNDAIQNVVRLMVSGNGKADETIIRFADNATTAFDSQMDAYKLSGGASVPTFYSLAGNTKLSVNSLPASSMEDFVTLAVEAGAANTYELSLAENTLSSSVYVTLEDTKTGVSQKLNDNPVYSFTATPGEDPSRFRLHFKDAASVANPVLAGINAYSVDGQIRITSDKDLNGLVTLTDMAGRLITKTNMTQATSCMLNVHGLTGIYVVNIATTDGNFVQKVVVK